MTGGDGGNSDRMPAGIYTIVESGLKYFNKTSNKAGKPLQYFSKTNSELPGQAVSRLDSILRPVHSL